MRNIKAIIIGLVLIALAGCSKSDVTVDKVFEGTTFGAVLRTLSVNNATFNFSDPSVKWSITVEAQDEEEGDLLSEVAVFVSQFRNGSRVGSEALVKTIPASNFVEGENGLPVGDVEVSLNEVQNALGLSENDYEKTDEFRIRLEYVTTDGRTFTNSDASGTVTNSSFFKSPYLYAAQFFCNLEDAALFDGEYVVTADAWADYSPGDVVPVVHNPEDGPYTFRIMSTNNPYIANTDSYMLVTIDPADGSVTVASNEPFDYGVLVPVSGTGSVGTCTGTIDLSLNFEGYASNQAFSLVKSAN